MLHISRVLRYGKVPVWVWVILCAWLTQTPTAGAQQQLKRLTVDDGLSQGFVHSVLQTRDGFLWVATLDGLNRYDGTGFKIFRHDPADPNSLNSDFVLELMEDSRGILWVITDRGPNLFDRTTGRFYHVREISQFRVNNANALRSLCEDPWGRIWATYDKEIVRFDFPANSLSAIFSDSLRIRTRFFPEESLGNIQELVQMDSALWILAEKGPCALSYQDNTLRPLPMSIPADVNHIWRDTFSGAIWMQGTQGISRFSEGRLEFYQPDGYAEGLIRGWSGPKSTYFFSPTKIYRWQNGAITELPDQVQETILSACEDANGVIWLGTNARGLVKVLTGRTQFTRYREGESQTNAPVEDDKGNIWIFNHSGSTFSYFRFDPADGQLKEPFHRLPQFYLIQSRDGDFWFISKKQTLCRVDGPNGPVRSYPCPKVKETSMTELLEDHLGRVGFLSSDAQMVFFDPRTETWSAWSFAHLFKPLQIPTLSSFIEDTRGCFWIGTSNGLVEAMPDGDGFRFKYFGSKAGLSRQRILSLSVYPKTPERLWIGTQHGLNWLHTSNDKIEYLSLRDGLPNDVIYSIVPADDSILWVGTNSGLLKINHISKRWQHFTKNDGLPESEFNTGMALRLHDGRLIFGGVGGLVIFQPDDILPSKIQPAIAITEILVNSKPYPNAILPDQPIRLRADQNYVSFRYALLDFVNPGSNRYQYRLVNASDEWTPLSIAKSVTFSNLRPGRYQIEVRGVNSEGVESKVTRLTFIISPPWWRSVWAYLTYAGIVFFSGRWFFQWRRRQIRFRETLAAEHREAERLKDLDLFKSKLYANITHEFRTPLTVILGVAEQLEQNRAIANPEQIRQISRNGEQLLRLVNQMLDWSKLENSQLQLRLERFDVTAFLQMAAEPFEALAASKDIVLQCRFPADALWIRTDPDRLNDIVANLLSNAVKFTPPRGLITLSLQIEPLNSLCIAVEDTGIGIAPEHLPHIFDRFYQITTPGSEADGTGIGLSYAQELAQFMGGTLMASSIPGKGTRIQFTLPQEEPLLPKAHFSTDENRINTGFDTEPTDPPEAELPLVLLIEDNADVARYTADCLSGRFLVDYADNGSDGIKKALDIIPDVVISDIMLPLKDGFKVCEAVKHDVRTSHIPVILLTARADEESRLQGLQYGTDVYLAKPFKKQELLLHLDNLLRLRAAIQARNTHSIQTGSLEKSPSTGMGGAGVQDEFVLQVMQLIAENYTDPDFGANSLQKAVHMSSSQLHRKLSALTGKSPGALLRLHRLEQSRRLLFEFPQFTVSEIAFRVGYRDSNYFIRAFTQEFGIAPGAYRKNRQ